MPTSHLANVSPLYRPAYLLVFGPTEVGVPVNTPFYLSYAPEYYESPPLCHELDYMTYDFQQTFYHADLVTQEEFTSLHVFKASFEIVTHPTYGYIEIEEYFPMHTRLKYMPGDDYRGMDGFKYRPIVEQKGFVGESVTITVSIT